MQEQEQERIAERNYREWFLNERRLGERLDQEQAERLGLRPSPEHGDDAQGLLRELVDAWEHGHWDTTGAKVIQRGRKLVRREIATGIVVEPPAPLTQEEARELCDLIQQLQAESDLSLATRYPTIPVTSLFDRLSDIAHDVHLVREGE